MVGDRSVCAVRQEKASFSLAFLQCIVQNSSEFAVFYDDIVLLCKSAQLGEQIAGINDVDGEKTKVKAYHKGESEVF